MSKKTPKKKLTDTLKLSIRNEFVQGIDNEQGLKVLSTLDELYKKHKVARATLYRAAKKDNWKNEREQFQRQYQEKLDQERIKNLTKESKKFDTNSINIAKSLLATVGQTINKNAIDISEGRMGLVATQINALANAAVTAQRLAKLALGEATDNMNVNANIKDTEAFRSAMELLDTVAEQRRKSDSQAVH